MSQALALTYDPVEDRLLLALTDGNGQERELHLTRRFTRLLVRRLEGLAERTAQAPAGVDAGQRESLAALHHDAQAGKVPIEKTRRPTPPPDARRPALATGVRTGRTRNPPERWIVEFQLQDGKTVKLTLSVRLLHGFIELIRRRLPATEWGVELLPEPADQRHRRVMH